MTKKLPRRITVHDVVIGRYSPGERPVDWEERLEGVEKILTHDGEEVSLSSSGGQSTPAPGWELLLTAEGQGGFLWTLYGIKPA